MFVVRRVCAWVVAAGFLFAGLAPASAVVEYVKVCSLYGAGFFYIPGTDTCIKVGGFYVGGSLGGRSTGDDVTNDQQITFTVPDPRPNPTSSVNSTGVYGNIFAGYNIVRNTFLPNIPVVLGVEGFIGTGSNKETITGIPGTGGIATSAVMANDSTTVDMGYNAGILGRLGTIVPVFGRFPVMVSLVGGVGFQHVETTLNCTGGGACGTNFIPSQMLTYNRTLTGSLIGFEVETPLPIAPSRGFSGNVRFQYLHGDYGNFSAIAGNPAQIQITANQRITTDQFTGGFVAHIDWGDGPPR